MIKTLICVLLLCSLHIKPIYPLTWKIKEASDVSKAKMTSFQRGLYAEITATDTYEWVLLDPFSITSSKITSYYITPLLPSGTGSINFGIQQAGNCWNTGYYYSTVAGFAPLLGNTGGICQTDVVSLYYPSVPSNAKTPSPKIFAFNKMYQWDVSTPSGATNALINIYGKYS